MPVYSVSAVNPISWKLAGKVNMHPMIKNIPDNWKKTIILLLMVSFLSFIFFYDSWVSMVEIWYRSSTFTHGFVIIPIFLWLIWTQRDYLVTLEPEVNWKIITAILISGFLWLLADLSHIQVIKQFATVAMLVSGLWLVLGNNVSKSLIFPLMFLFLMVPVGEELVPILMEFTATFTVWLIRLTGMSVYREGLHFSLISGDWSVVQACSGINYLISSITLGIVYAYLTYQYAWKRCLFILLSIIVPVFANGFRAYLIVMIGHFSGMTLAVGVDHLIYGGLFFGLVMLILFYVGSFWRDPPREKFIADEQPIAAQEKKGNVEKGSQVFIPIVIIALSYSIWPIGSAVLSNQSMKSSIQNDFSGIEEQGWKKTTDVDWKWQADFKNVEQESINYFTKQGVVVALYQASFGKETQGGGELVNSQNKLLSNKDENWKIVDRSSLAVGRLSEGRFIADEAILRGKDSDLLTIRWYRIGEKNTSNDYVAKLLQLKKLLMLDSSPEYINVAVIEAHPNRPELARKQLINWLEQWLNLKTSGDRKVQL